MRDANQTAGDFSEIGQPKSIRISIRHEDEYPGKKFNRHPLSTNVRRDAGKTCVEDVEWLWG